MIIDTHIHLDDPRFNEDIEEVLERARENGVKAFIIPGADPKTLKRAQGLSERFSDVFFAIGVHPYDLESYDEAYLLTYAKHIKCVAVGECGLDYFRLPDDEAEKTKVKQIQAEIFKNQIALAKRLKKPLIVHIRDASHDAKNILMQEGAGEVGGVLHCYNADEELLSLADHDFYFGIGGVVTFKNAKRLVNVLPKIPKERLLIETDAPYLTPHPHRGERNEPSYTTLVIKKMEELLDIPFNEMAEITSLNAKTLFRLPAL